jgi:hypothetical protein
MLQTLIAHMAAGPLLTAKAPDFTNGDDPPFAGKLNTVGHWVFIGVMAMCVIGLLIIGAQLVNAHQHGEAQQATKKLGWAFVGLVVVGTASGLVTALT